MKHVNHKITFRKGDIDFHALIRTEHPQPVNNLLAMLVADRFRGPNGVLMSRDMLKEMYVDMAYVGDEEAARDFHAETMVIRTSTPYGDRFVAPSGQVRPCVILFSNDGIVMSLEADVDKALLAGMRPNSTPSPILSVVTDDSAIAPVLSDILKEEGKADQDAGQAIAEVFRKHPEILWAHGIFPTAPKIAAIAGCIPDNGPRRYEKLLLLDDDLAERIEAYLSNEEHLDEDDTVTLTAQFPDGRQMDIKCCGTQDENECAWTEAVLFDPSGNQLCYTEPEDDFIGPWELKADGVTYRVEVDTLAGHRERIRKEAYRRYQLDWMISHGRSVSELAEHIVEQAKNADPEDILSDDGQLFDQWEGDVGFNGSLYACYDEFLGAEYRDPDYMRHLLPDDLYENWQALET